MSLVNVSHDSGGGALAVFGPAGADRDAIAARDVLGRLAKTIQLMRLDHADAHLYRDGCDALVQTAVQGSAASELEVALTDVMRHVENGDYHWALQELRVLNHWEPLAC